MSRKVITKIEAVAKVGSSMGHFRGTKLNSGAEAELDVINTPCNFARITALGSNIMKEVFQFRELEMCKFLT